MKPLDPRPVVALCLPCGDQVKTEFMLSLVAMTVYCNAFRYVLIRGSSSIVTVARDHCVDNVITTEENIIKQQIDWMLWLDSDIEFPYNTLSRLVSHDRDIVGAAYCRRSHPYDVMVKRINDQPILQDHGIVEVEALPMGCMLVRRSVFAGFTRPWFRLDFSGGRTESEDLVFCRAARSQGHSVYCDLDLTAEIAHVGSFAFKADRPMSEQQGLSDAA